jgi:hypothetical protein
MEPEAHRLDREAMLAERVAIAERVRRDVDEIVGAAASMRRAYLDWFVTRMRIEAAGEHEREQRWADLRLAFTTGPDTAREPDLPTAHRIGSWEDADVDVAPLAWATTG